MIELGWSSPLGWRTVPLSSLAVEKGIVSGPFGSNISSKFFRDEGIPGIRGNNLPSDSLKPISAWLH